MLVGTLPSSSLPFIMLLRSWWETLECVRFMPIERIGLSLLDEPLEPLEDPEPLVSAYIYRYESICQKTRITGYIG